MALLVVALVGLSTGLVQAGVRSGVVLQTQDLAAIIALVPFFSTSFLSCTLPLSPVPMAAVGA